MAITRSKRPGAQKSGSSEGASSAEDFIAGSDAMPTEPMLAAAGQEPVPSESVAMEEPLVQATEMANTESQPMRAEPEVLEPNAVLNVTPVSNEGANPQESFGAGSEAMPVEPVMATAAEQGAVASEPVAMVEPVAHVAQEAKTEREPVRIEPDTNQALPVLHQAESEPVQASPERADQALAVVKAHLPWAGGAGLLPVPGLDFVAIAGVQLNMVNELAKTYGVTFKEQAAKSFISALMAAVLEGGLSGALLPIVKWVPIFGPILGLATMPAVAAAATYAVGKVFILHFESGGTFLDFDPDSVRDHFRREYEHARQHPPGSNPVA